MEGSIRITQVFEAAHQLALHVRQMGTVLEIGTYPVRSLPGDYLFDKPGAAILPHFRSYVKYLLSQLMPLTDSKDAYLLAEPGRGRICQADQGLKSKYVAVIAGRLLTQDLNGALSLAGVQDATGPGQDYRFP